MGRMREGELSASAAAVLGLLIERPNTAAGLEKRLSKRFPSAEWSRTAAHSALRSFEDKRYVCVVVAPRTGGGADVSRGGDGGGSPPGMRPDVSALLARTRGRLPPEAVGAGEESDDGRVFEAMPGGVEVFWRWLRKADDPDPLRDELRMKISFSRPEHAPRLIELIEEEERHYEREYKLLHESIGPLEDLIEDESYVTGQEWSALMTILLLRDEMAIWLARLNQRGRLREYLESLRDEARRRVSAGGPGGRR